ncbi:MAG: signal peptidase I [Clostridia bacterium]|nr:signal peptidase I [Clostridia bacterium]
MKKEFEDIEFEEVEEKSSFGNTLLEWLDSLVISFIVVVLLFTFFLGKVKVDGESMNNTLQDSDQLIISDFMYKPQRKDIVIISRNPKNIYGDSAENEPIVKRVIAVAGDTIEITDDNKVLLNDEEIDEPYIKDYALGTGTPNDEFKKEMKRQSLGDKLKIPEGRIFVMGDNRYNSHDSRKGDIWLVDERYVLGKVLFRIYPFDSIDTF